MRGPYSLEFLEDYVEPNTIGVYMLGGWGYSKLYVGRSDTNLLSRIKTSAVEGWPSQRYLFFWYEYATSAMRAYKLECKLWHKYQPPDNVNHPAQPWGMNWKCPVQGCLYC